MSVAEKYTTLTEKIPQVYESGKQAEYDAFWDNFQEKGNRKAYDYAFRSNGWNNTNFKPKYDIKPTTAVGLFYTCDIADMADILEKQGVTLDLSSCPSLSNLCLNSPKLTRMPKIDASSATTIASVFSWCQKLNTIDEFVFSSKLTNANTAFGNCVSLVNFIASGEIACTISFQYSPLSPASMKSVINALKNYSGTNNEGSNTVTFTSDCWTALEADSTAPDGGTWQNYVESLGWNT